MELLVYVKPILKKNSQKAGASSNKYIAKKLQNLKQFSYMEGWAN